MCVCCQVEVPAKGLSLVQKSPIEWMCVRVWFWNLNNEAAKARVRLFAPQEKKYEMVSCACYLAELISFAVYMASAVHHFLFRIVMSWTPSVRDQRPSIFRYVTWSRFVFVYRHFEVAYQSRLQRPRIRKKFRGVTQRYGICAFPPHSLPGHWGPFTRSGYQSCSWKYLVRINYGQRGKK
jgi:hypothetical protein